MDKKELMDRLVREAYEKGVFNGTWLYAENGKIVSKGAVGMRDAFDTLPMRESSIFELASVSKQFTAAAIMLLRRRGLLSLDDELNKFYPRNPYKGITIRHLLDHTSGLPDHEDWAIEALKGETVIPRNDLSVRFLSECGLEPLFKPGEKFEYSNTAYCILAEIVEKVSGMTFEEFMRKEIFEPAGMFSTWVCHIRIGGVPFDDFARGLVYHNGGYAVPDDLEEYSYVKLLDGESGDGFVYSNIFDMYFWDRALRKGKLLTKEEQELMYTPGKLSNGENGTFGEEHELGYGFGWDVYDFPKVGRTVLHDGGWPGYATHFERGLDSDRMLILLCSRIPEDIRGLESFFEAMCAAARDAEPKPILTLEDIALKEPDKSAWPGFCGRYEKLDEDFPLEEVFMKDGELYARVVDEDGAYEYRLYPTGENEFGRKAGYVKLTFGEGTVKINDTECKKL